MPAGSGCNAWWIGTGTMELPVGRHQRGHDVIAAVPVAEGRAFSMRPRSLKG